MESANSKFKIEIFPFFFKSKFYLSLKKSLNVSKLEILTLPDVSVFGEIVKILEQILSWFFNFGKYKISEEKIWSQ